MSDSKSARLAALSDARKDWHAVLRVAELMHGRDFWRVYDEVRAEYNSSLNRYTRVAYGNATNNVTRAMRDVDSYESQSALDF